MYKSRLRVLNTTDKRSVNEFNRTSAGQQAAGRMQAARQAGRADNNKLGRRRRWRQLGTRWRTDRLTQYGAHERCQRRSQRPQLTLSSQWDFSSHHYDHSKLICRRDNARRIYKHGHKPFKVIQGHRFRHWSNSSMRLPTSYLVPHSTYRQCWSNYRFCTISHCWRIL